MLLMLLLFACAAPEKTDDPWWSRAGVTLTPAGTEGAEIALDGDVLRGVAEAGAERAVLRLRWELAGEPQEEPVWWRQGWQSWSWSGVVALPEAGAAEPEAGGDGDTYSVVEETADTSWEAALLGVPGGPSLHVGALSAARGKVWLGVTAEELRIVWERPEGELEPVQLSAGDDPAALWGAWADRISGRSPGAPPTGWSDWYTWYGEATEADILRNLAAAEGLGLSLLQVDDGWERAWGDWEANAAFPSGTAALAAEIAGRGLTPGIWMAPLLVDRSTATYTENPGWWVREPGSGAGGPELMDGACDCATLDVTVPEAAAWLQAQIRAKVAEGWRYLKLDFLYAGAREGDRSEPLSGAAAYARATGLLRDAAGEDTWILACGAPMLPSVGFADSWRSGADIAFFIAPEPDRAFLRWQARSTAARSWANGRWWWNDADNLMLGADPAAALAAQAASGGVWMYGEDLEVLAAEAAAGGAGARADLMDLRGVRYTPESPLSAVSGIDGSPLLERAAPDDAVPVRWRGEDGTVVLLNLSDAPVETDGPGGTERISGAQAPAGRRTLAPGAGEIWAP